MKKQFRLCYVDGSVMYFTDNFEHQWGDDWDETYNDFWSGIDSDDDDYDYDFDDITYNVPNGDGGFDTLTYDDVFDENGTFIYDYTGPGSSSPTQPGV